MKNEEYGISTTTQAFLSHNIQNKITYIAV
jgi:hypothetical protein